MIDTALRLSQDAARDLVPDIRAPVGYRTIKLLNLLRGAHKLWRIRRQYQLLTQDDAVRRLVHGQVLEITAGDQQVVRLACRYVLIARRVLDCALHTVSMVYDRRTVHSAITGRSIRLRHNSPLKKFNRFLSPSRGALWRRAARSIVDHTVAIATYAMRFITKAFALPMHLMDIVEAFSERVNQSAVTEVFFHSSRLIEQAEEGGHQLIEELSFHRQTVDRVLTHLGGSYTVNDLTHAVNRVLRGADRVERIAERVPERFRDAVLRIGQGVSKILFGETPEWYR